ncbi:MAG: hypothetical protein ABI840_13100, partial [bacterium]
MLLKFKLIFCLAAIAVIVFSQDSFSQKKKVSKERQPVVMKKDNSPLSRTPVNNYSQQEVDIISQMNQYKQPDNLSQDGDKILDLQNLLETSNGSTVTKQERNSFGTVIIPQNNSDNIFSTDIFDGDYIAAIATQVEQRGAGNGKIWVAIGHSSLDTGAGARGDTIKLFYSIDGGTTYTKYVSVAFSPANKIGFDDLDMEIIENNSG